MKKIIFAIAIFSIASQPTFATQQRIDALGGETAMIADDDTNIDLFPQTINRQNLVRLSSIESNTPNYAVITGKAGNKWGLYGGTAQQNDFLNIYRSLDANSAVKLGFALGRYSEEDKADNKEATPGNSSSTEKNSYYSLAVDGVYGINKGDAEIAARGFFYYKPNAIGAVTGGGSMLAGPFGTYEFSGTTGTTTSKSDGEGNSKAFGGSLSIRKPMKLAIFNKVFASGFASYSSNSSNASAGAAKLEDLSNSTISLVGQVLFFDEKKIGDKSRIVYGIGGTGVINRFSTKNKILSTDTKITTISFTGPQIRMGIESDLKYGIVRFGLRRDFSLLSYEKTSATVASGAVNDNNSNKVFSIATAGNYAVSTGFGIVYKSLKIDVSLNRFFWVHGPQMIFDSQNGRIAGSADVLYTF